MRRRADHVAYLFMIRQETGAAMNLFHLSLSGPAIPISRKKIKREAGWTMQQADGQSPREEIVLALNAKFPVMRRLFGVKKVGIFGSLARGEDRHDSDVDIEVEFETGMDTYANFIGLARFLEELVGRRVDLVLSRVLASYLRPELGATHAAMSRDRVYLSQILDEIAFLSHRTRGISSRDFQKDETLRRAVMRSLEIIGESAARVSEQTRKDTPKVPWMELEGLRSHLLHPYFSPDWAIVWNVLNVYLPTVEPLVRAAHSRIA